MEYEKMGKGKECKKGNKRKERGQGHIVDLKS